MMSYNNAKPCRPERIHECVISIYTWLLYHVLMCNYMREALHKLQNDNAGLKCLTDEIACNSKKYMPIRRLVFHF